METDNTRKIKIFLFHSDKNNLKKVVSENRREDKLKIANVQLSKMDKQQSTGNLKVKNANSG